MRRALVSTLGLAFVLLAGVAQAQVPDDYFPFDVGNTWTYYQVGMPGSPDTTFFSGSILGTTTLDGVVYHQHSFDFSFFSLAPIRKDDLGRVVQYQDGGEVVLFDFTLPPGATYEVLLPHFSDPACVVEVGELDVETAAGSFEHSRTFHFCQGYADAGEYISFAPGVGLVQVSEIYIWGTVTSALARVNFSVDITMANEADDGATPTRPVVRSIYPNPFSEQLSVLIEAPATTYGAPVEVAVYDALGRRVRALEAGASVAGRLDLTWDGRDAQGRRVTSGVYFMRVQAGTFSESRPVIFVQ